ncbi:foldase protein PrsA [Delftia sp. NA_296.1]|uniref:foldase protein PrsA n=1 Tax=Delftia TaxID=80865 RepID=UPI000BC3591F|nr:peptidylprolyl isomerase [Delftia acidovorans]ATH13525.1 peptidylprolyl isomerase [Delftia acidovorans]
MTVSIQRLSSVSLALVLAFAAHGAHSADKIAPVAAQPATAPSVLVQGKGIAISSQDVLADAQRIPPEVRPMILGRSQNVGKMASDLYVLRTMAQMAQQHGMDRDSQVQASLQVARDKVLADAWLAALDEKNMPSVEVAEKQALTLYQAQPDRFKVDGEVRARHILISGKDSEARAKADRLLDEIKNGGDFAALAKEHSADKGSGARGGELGFFGKGRMVPEFEQAVFALQKPGDLSGVVESKFGFHIIQLEELRPAGVKPFAEVRDELVKGIRNSAAQEARAIAAEKIRKDGTLDAAAAESFATTKSPNP